MLCAYHLCPNEIVPLTKRKKRFCSKTCCLRHKVRKWRIELKNKAVAYKGGCCTICGYNKCVRALEFHHRDRETKLFAISHNGNTRSWERVQRELDKCDLVCSNCHKELEEKYENQKYLESLTGRIT